MAEIYFTLLKEIEKQGDLVHKESIELSDSELETLQKKATNLKMSVSALLRIYICQTSAFDMSPFMDKKAKKSLPKIARGE